MIRRTLFIIAAFLSTSWADQIAVSKWGYLNSNENAAVIDQSQSQDLLNVDVTPGGASIKKRQGYGLYKALSTGQGLKGGFHFFDSTGNDVQIWGSSTSLYGIVADATPTQLISSATLNATWDCADTQGYAYCVNSGRDALIKTDGATRTWYTSPLGTMVDVTPDRLIVAGVSGSPNTLYISESNTFTDFVVGNNPTDAYTEVIASPGSKLTHIRSACGKVLWWKDQSFGTYDFDDQFTAQVRIVSDTIGTFDNSSAIDPGGNVWFRGQDGHIWKYDCSSLSKESIDISPNTQASSKRVANLWTQTSQSDFEAGAAFPPLSLSFAASAGDVTVSSFTVVENSSSQWSSGSLNAVTVGSSTIFLSTNSNQVSNNSFENGSITNWTLTTQNATTCAQTSDTAHDGSKAVKFVPSFTGSSHSFGLRVLDASGNQLEDQGVLFGGADTGWVSGNVTFTGNYTSQMIKFQFYLRTSRVTPSPATGQCMATSDPFISNGLKNFTIWGRYYDATTYYMDFLDGAGMSNISSGTFISQSYDTGISSPIVQLQATTSVNVTVPRFSLQTSTSATGTWTNISFSTGTNASGYRYVRYVSTFPAPGSTDNAASTINSATIIARSTGSYYSAVKNAPSLTAWSTISMSDSSTGAGAITYFTRSSTNAFTILSSTPSWVSQTKNGSVAASTGTYFQVRADLSIVAATETATVSDFTFNWYEGSASDQAYSVYFDNAIWWAVAYGAGQSTNNYIFKYDLINQGWTLYNFGAGGLMVQNNSLYFGQVDSGNIFKFGANVKSDNGTAIQSYWKSKDFTGPDPFLEVALTNIDTFAKRDANQSLTASYALNSSTTTTSYTINLSSTTDSVIRNKKLLPSGKIGGTFNIQYGDTADSSAWEVFGFRIGFTPQPYRPTQ